MQLLHNIETKKIFCNQTYIFLFIKIMDAATLQLCGFEFEYLNCSTAEAQELDT